MPGMKEIKNRISSVSDTQKITNAMYMIASTKLRRAKQDLDSTRPYFDSLEREIHRIFSIKDDVESVYFYPKGIHEDDDIGGTYGYLVITADKGLAGAYNHNVIKKTMELMEKHDDNRLFVVGDVGRRYFEYHNVNIDESFLYMAQKPSFQRADEMSKKLLDMYASGELTRLYIIYTDMKNSISQEVSFERLLPLDRDECRDEYVGAQIEADGGESIANMNLDYEFMPSPSSVLDSIVPNAVTGYIYSALVDSFCCEQNARMMAMDSANTNAEQIREALKMEYNHLRQNAITQEITEVAAGAKAKRKKLERDKEKRLSKNGN